MANSRFDTMLTGGFGVVTVMNAKLYKYSKRYSGSRGTGEDTVVVPTEFYKNKISLDTLKIANLTMEGPTKTITGGQYANPLIKYGKTMTIEMQDALGTKDALVEFMGCKEGDGRLSVTDKFPGAFAIEGETFFIDQQTGDKVTVYIFIPQLLPDAIFNLTQDAEGDATVFDLNGSVCLTKIADSEEDAADTTDPDKVREVFYEIREKSFFDGKTLLEPTAAA